MQTLLLIVIGTLIAMVAVAEYMLIRNRWVFKVRLRWIDMSPRMRPDPWYVFGYEEMLNRYWWVWSAEWFERRALGKTEKESK